MYPYGIKIVHFLLRDPVRCMWEKVCPLSLYRVFRFVTCVTYGIKMSILYRLFRFVTYGIKMSILYRLFRFVTYGIKMYILYRLFRFVTCGIKMSIFYRVFRFIARGKKPVHFFTALFVACATSKITTKWCPGILRVSQLIVPSICSC